MGSEEVRRGGNSEEEKGGYKIKINTNCKKQAKLILNIAL
jgi:hypothetical protein